MTSKRRENNTITYILSFAIPMFLYIAVGALLRLYPLSDNTILWSDMNNQLISFYTAFKHMLTGGATGGTNITGALTGTLSSTNLAYTFSKNLGGDMIGFSAYYLQNPFLLILLLFPDEKLALGIYIMEILMLSTAGLTFQVFITRTFGRSSLIFSTAYAMMGYSLAFFMLPIYFCNIILLPIVIMGLCLMLDESRSGKIIYTIALASSIFTNYYLGYMLCLFLALYFVYLCAMDSHEILRKAKPFITYSILGVMISCWDLIPIVLSLRNQKDAPGSSIFELHRMFSLTSLYRAMLPGAFNGDISNYALPYIYIGIIPAACILLYIFNRKIPLISRIASIIFMGIMILCFYISPLNTIWHAFNAPVGFAHRFAFYFSFLMLVIGYQGYINCKFLNIRNTSSIDIKNKIIKDRKVNIVDENNIENNKHAFLSNIKNNKFACVISMALLALTALDLSYNAAHSLKCFTNGCTPQSQYESTYTRIRNITDGFKALEPADSLYRAEKDFQFTMEDAMLFDYAGLSHNSSCEKDYAKQFMGNMGLRYQGIWAFYNQGATAFTDSLLGVKYYVSRFDTTEKPYERVLVNEPGESYDISYTFRNPYAMPFGFIVDSDRASTVDLNTNNLFKIQNDIAHCFNFEEDIHTESEISAIRVSGNVVLSDDFAAHSDTLGISETQIAGSQAYVEFDIPVSASGKIMYFYFAAPHKQGARIFVNGTDWDDYFSDWRWAIEKVGMFGEGDNVTIRVEATGDELLLDDFFIYYEDLDKLAAWYSCAAPSFDLRKQSASHLSGTFTAAKAGLLTLTIPYEKGWHIKIDGQKVEQKMLFDALTAIEVSEGAHTIEMTYIPEGLIIGLLITLAGIALFIFTLRKRTA